MKDKSEKAGLKLSIQKNKQTKKHTKPQHSKN